MDANAELAKLQEQRSRAASRVGELEAEWRQAVEATRTASAALAEVERNGAGAPTRHKAEEALAAAKVRAAEPWAERIEGARAAARDVDRAYRAHVAANLGALVEELEGAGEAAAEHVNAAAAALVAAHAEWGAVATRIGALITTVARPSPGDVTYGRPEADEAARGAIALVNAGGERGPRLDQSRPPWDALLGEDDVVNELADADADADVVTVVA